MYALKNYYIRNEKSGDLKLNRERICKYCGSALIWHDNEEGNDLYICSECNACDVYEDGKVKYVMLY